MSLITQSDRISCDNSNNSLLFVVSCLSNNLHECWYSKDSICEKATSAMPLCRCTNNYFKWLLLLLTTCFIHIHILCQNDTIIKFNAAFTMNLNHIVVSCLSAFLLAYTHQRCVFTVRAHCLLFLSQTKANMVNLELAVVAKADYC